MARRACARALYHFLCPPTQSGLDNASALRLLRQALASPGWCPQDALREDEDVGPRCFRAGEHRLVEERPHIVAKFDASSVGIRLNRGVSVLQISISGTKNRFLSTLISKAAAGAFHGGGL